MNGETRHLTPALSPFCFADSAKRGEGETLAACPEGKEFWFKVFFTTALSSISAYFSIGVEASRTSAWQ